MKDRLKTFLAAGLLFCSGLLSAAPAKAKLITLGTGAGIPSMTRHNSLTCLVTAHGYYLIDAGGPVFVLMVRKELDLNKVRAVFITHMHEDHFGGLLSFLKNRMRGGVAGGIPKGWLGFWPEVWLPDPDAPEAFDRVMALQFRGERRERIKYRVIKPGLFYDDGFLKVTAIPNRHFTRKDGFLPAYCFLLEFEGKKLVCTGDLSKDLSDFPVEAAKNADLVLCEFTHFDLMMCRETFRKIRPGKLVFTHVAKKNLELLPEFSRTIDYPVAVANDGDEFEF